MVTRRLTGCSGGLRPPHIRRSESAATENKCHLILRDSVDRLAWINRPPSPLHTNPRGFDPLGMPLPVSNPARCVTTITTR